MSELCFVSQRGHGKTGTCLTEAARILQARGLRLAGTVAVGDPCTDPACEMQLQILPDGPLVNISQNLGRDAKGCRLDGGALEQAVVEVSRRQDGAQLLVINKFGKLEAVGRGFVPLIAAALGDGIPVVIGVNAANLPDLLAFAGDMARELPADAQAIADWALALA